MQPRNVSLQYPQSSNHELTITRELDLSHNGGIEQQKHRNPISGQSGEEQTDRKITSGAITSKDIGSHMQSPASFPVNMNEREQPDYAVPDSNYKHVTAYNIWLANRLSIDPCKACRAAHSDCWVKSDHVSCARCTGGGRSAKRCGAKGTKFNLVDNK